MKRLTAVKKTREKWHPVEHATITLLQVLITDTDWLATMTDEEIKKKLCEKHPISEHILDRVLSQSADDGGPVLKRPHSIRRKGRRSKISAG